MVREMQLLRAVVIRIGNSRCGEFGEWGLKIYLAPRYQDLIIRILNHHRQGHIWLIVANPFCSHQYPVIHCKTIERIFTMNVTVRIALT